MECKKRKIHYAWFVMAACFAFYGGSMGVGYNCGGVFNAAISKALGWSISKYTFSTVFLGLASALTLFFVDRIFRKFPLKLVLGSSILLYALTLAAKCLCTKLWQFCLVYALNGVGAAFLFYVPVPMLINSWFHKRAGFALGISVLSSGIMGTLMNPVLSAIIESRGWQTAAVVNGAVSLVFSLPLVLAFAVRSPEEIGLKPYGYEEKEATGENGKKTENGSVPEQEKTACFAASFVLAIIVLIISMIPQQLAHFAQVGGLGAAVGASLVSVGMSGNLVSKAVMGPCVDRFGKKKTFVTSFLLVAFAFLIYALFPDASLFILYPAAFLTGITAANNVVVMPNMVNVYAGGEEYLTYMSKVSMATMIATALGTYVSSAIYDLTGSYTWEFLLYLAADLAGLALVLRILKAEKYKEESNA